MVEFGLEVPLYNVPYSSWQSPPYSAFHSQVHMHEKSRVSYAWYEPHELEWVASGMPLRISSWPNPHAKWEKGEFVDVFSIDGLAGVVVLRMWPFTYAEGRCGTFVTPCSSDISDFCFLSHGVQL
jgi:hypothetical protein